MALLISWLLSPSAVILEPKKIKSVTVSTFPPSICHEYLFILNDIYLKYLFGCVGSYLCSGLSSFAHRLQAPGSRVLELSSYIACGILSSLPRDQSHVPCIARQILNCWITREVFPICFTAPQSFSSHLCSLPPLPVLRAPPSASCLL